MAASIISRTVRHTVVLDTGQYESPLRVTRAGAIEPVGHGATGLYAPASATDARVVNAGRIAGGHGGGVGVDFESAGRLINRGAITGGKGAAGEAGGLGVRLPDGGRFLNEGLVSGGRGGAAPATGEAGGKGGDGVDLAGNAVLINTGVIEGGKGGPEMQGGVGVYIDGGTLVTSGIISGGAPGAYEAPSQYAVRFGNTPGRLVIEPGASFRGGIALGKDAADTLELAGGTAGYFGSSEIATGYFRDCTLDAGADWTLGGANAFDDFRVDGTLTLTGHLTSAIYVNEIGAAIAIASGATIESESAGVPSITIEAPSGANVTVSNSGTIGAGNPGLSPNRDIGIDLVSGGILVNAGLVQGDDDGGVGVSLGAGCVLTNQGTVTGAPRSGYGAIIYAGGSATNAGTILGSNHYDGTGVDLRAGGTLANTGFIAGVGGGTGIAFEAGAALSNMGTISGGAGIAAGWQGYGGGAGVALGQGSHWSNAGLVEGGDGGPPFARYGVFGLGGAAIAALQGATVDNARSGRLVGGGGAPGGSGILLAGASALTNEGNITGGDGLPQARAYTTPGKGGAGVDLQSGSHGRNDGVITGGQGGYGYGITNEIAGIGGAGVALSGQTNFVNDGTITGGQGGNQYVDKSASGGAGVTIGPGCVITNFGRIVGGAGGNSLQSKPVGNTGTSGDGGAGVFINGGAIIDSGYIAGGAPGTALRDRGIAGDAVQFGALGGTLIVQAGANGVGYDIGFGGVVEGDASSHEKLILAGTIDPGVFDANVIAVSAMDVQAGSDWFVTGNAMLGGTSAVGVSGTLTVNGLLSAGQATVTASGGLFSNGDVRVAGVALQGGGMICDPGATFSIGGGSTHAGTIAIASHAVVAGNGLIDGAMDCAGMLQASGGELSFYGAQLSGSGTAAIGSGATLSIEGSLSIRHVAFDSGGGAHLIVADPVAAGPPAPLFAGFGTGDTIDIGQLTTTSLNFADGTLTLADNGTVVEALTFSGDYTTQDFSMTQDGAGGVLLRYVGTPTIADFDTRRDTYPPPGRPREPMLTHAGWADAFFTEPPVSWPLHQALA